MLNFIVKNLLKYQAKIVSVFKQVTRSFLFFGFCYDFLRITDFVSYIVIKVNQNCPNRDIFLGLRGLNVSVVVLTSLLLSQT